MKTAALLFLLAALPGCSPNQASSAPERPVTSDDTDPVEEQAVIDLQEQADPEALMKAILSSIPGTADGQPDTGYDITSRIASAGEVVEGKWRIDSTLNILVYKTTWSSEYFSGVARYHFRDNNLVSGTEENQYNDYLEKVYIHESFKPVYGFSLTDGTENDSIPYFLQEGDFASRNSQVHEAFISMVARIRELADVNVSGDAVIELVAGDTVEGEFVETERYTIRKSLLNALRYQ